ncbi:MAG: chemotaxis protein CheW [Geovibrio sp.]|nr:chemotaxis protein CheW [Geovibrio sp.]
MAEMRQIVSLMLSGEKYGINIMDIEEILRMMDITKVPKAPAFVEGIINLRGQVIPIVDLRKKARYCRSGRKRTDKNHQC